MDEGQRTLCRLPELTAATKAGGARKRSFAALPGRATAGAAAPGSEASGETSGLPPFAARVPPEPPCWGRGAPAGQGSEPSEFSDSSVDSQAESLPPPWDERYARWEVRTALRHRGSPRTTAGSAATAAGLAGEPVFPVARLVVLSDLVGRSFSTQSCSDLVAEGHQAEADVQSGNRGDESSILKKKPKADAAGTLKEPPKGAKMAGAGGSDG